MKQLRTTCLALGGIVGGYLLYLYGPAGLEALYNAMRIDSAHGDAHNVFTVAAAVVFGIAIGMALLGNWTYRLIETLWIGWDGMHPGQRISVMVAIGFGVFMTVPFVSLFSSVQPTTAAGIYVGLMVMLSAIFYRVLQSVDDLLPWSKNRGKGKRTNIKVLDTNVIIDGRIFDVVRAGFLDGQLYVPRFVLDELQYIADSPESLRRQRGKRGLEVLQEMRSKFSLEVGTYDRFVSEGDDEVDARLVRLARAIGADLVTNDHNLNRVAALQEVRVININELALALRPNVLPGETMEINIYKEGSQSGQGVGYLDDGTMVVVENGRRHVGETMIVAVTQVHQTERGKMIFAEIPSEHDGRVDYEEGPMPPRRNKNPRR